MDRALLIDAVVRRAADLVAELAIEGATIHSLGHVSDLFFQALDTRLRLTHDKPQRVVADIFQMPLRTYQHRLRAVTESASIRNTTVWRAVYRYVSEHGPVRGVAVEHRFAQEKFELIRSILKHMVHTGVVFVTGRGGSALYRVNDDIGLVTSMSPESDARLVWVAAYKRPDAALSDLAADLGAEGNVSQEARLRNALASLVDRGAVATSVDGNGITRYRAHDFVMAPNDAAAVHAALYDHFCVVIDAMCQKLREQSEERGRTLPTGGATYRFDLPTSDEELLELDLLARFRSECSALRQGLESEHGGTGPARRLVFYFGQMWEEIGDTDKSASQLEAEVGPDL